MNRFLSPEGRALYIIREMGGCMNRNACGEWIQPSTAVWLYATIIEQMRHALDDAKYLSTEPNEAGHE